MQDENEGSDRGAVPRRLWAVLSCSGAIAMASALAAAQDYSKVEVRTVDVGSGIAMLAGAGGNIAVCVGEDGAIVVDDEFAPLVPRIEAAVAAFARSRGARPEVRFVLNTHWHGDHTGGNEALARAGALIVAHDNVRTRMTHEQVMPLQGRTVPPSPPLALPVLTFDHDATLYRNGQTLRAIHVPHAHTDGDVLVHFVEANVLHMGDTFFAGTYPFIDLESGGSLEGVIDAVRRGLALADAQTRIIPGHGPLSDRDGLRAYLDMLVEVRDAVQAAIDAGQTLEQVRAAHPLRSLDARWAHGFIDGDTMVAIAYRSLAH